VSEVEPRWVVQSYQREIISVGAIHIRAAGEQGFSVALRCDREGKIVIADDILEHRSAGEGSIEIARGEKHARFEMLKRLK
jgi:hypothetical protein